MLADEEIIVLAPLIEKLCQSRYVFEISQLGISSEQQR